MISCCMIVRDEEATLEACLKSVQQHVDELVIVDTGSADRTPEIARAYADTFEVYRDCNNVDTGLIENFAQARNRSFELAKGDWVFWVDGDDVVEGAEHLTRLADGAPPGELVSYLMPYHYAHDDQGRVTVHQWRERLLHPRERYQWQFPIHEILSPKNGGEIVGIQTDAVVVHHCHSVKAREPGRNLRILRAYQQQVGPNDTRTLFYLGIELHACGELGEALTTLKRYVRLALWTDERCIALEHIADIYFAIGDYDSSEEWALKAAVTKSWPAAFFILARCFFARAERGEESQYNYRRCIVWAEMGLKMPENTTLLFRDTTERNDVHLFLSVAYERIGKFDKAIESATAGLEQLPGHPELAANLAKFQEQQAKHEVKRHMAALVRSGRVANGADKIVSMALETKHLTEHRPEERPDSGCLDIVFFCLMGDGRPWDWDTCQAGAGGSETMLVEMAVRLARLGHRVRVYAQPPTEGLRHGVEWLSVNRFVGVECDVMIASRSPQAVDDMAQLKAKARVLWVHDVHCGDELQPRRAQRFDEIWCLSEWHRGLVLETYPWVGPRRVKVTRNGIDLSLFEQEVERNPHKAVYSSSPDRGLELALELWPEVRKEVPDAELHVFYGFDLLKRMGGVMPGPTQLTGAELEAKAKATEGVVLRGRVPKAELAREFLSAGVWAYPTWFSETSCITAMEAQAAGLWVVTSSIAALVETVETGVLLTEPYRSPEYREEWTRAVIDSLKLDIISERWPISRIARERFGLGSLAADWSGELKALVERVERDVVPPFEDVRLP